MRRLSWSVLMFALLLSSPPSRAAEPSPAEEEPIYQGKTLSEWIGGLKDPQWETNRIAVKALAVFGPKKETVSALRTVLKSDDVRVVLIAAQTLGKFGVKAKEALPELRGAYKRVSAGPPKLAPGERYLDGYVKLFTDACRAVAEALILIDTDPGPELAPILIEALKSDDADKRRDIVIKLGKLGPEAAKTTVPALIGVLTHTENRVQRPTGSSYVRTSSSDIPLEKIKEIRREAVKSLGRIGPPAKPALHAITLAMKSAAPDKNSRVIQMEASDKPVGSADATIPTKSFTFFTDKAMLQACAEALARIRPEAKGTFGALRLALRDLDEGIRWAALCALLETGQDPKDLMPFFLKFLRDKDAAYRRIAVEASVKFGAETKQVVPAVTRALKDEDASVRESAAGALGEFGPKAKQCVSALIPALKDSEEQVRRQAAESLGKIRVTDKDVIPALIAALEDKDDDVVMTAGEALTKFGAEAKTAIPALIIGLKTSGPQKRSIFCFLLGQFGPVAKEAIPALEKTPQDDPDECVRLGAYTALAKIDSSRAKDTVIRLIDSIENKEVRGAAVECLGLLGPDARDALPVLRRLREDAPQIAGVIDIAIEAIEKPKKKPGER